MRVVQNPQMTIGEVDISQIKFDLKSRDDIPKILRGLQHLYMDIPLRTKKLHRLKAAPSHGQQSKRILANGSFRAQNVHWPLISLELDPLGTILRGVP